MYIPYSTDLDFPVQRLRINVETGKLLVAPKKELFIRGRYHLSGWVEQLAYRGRRSMLPLHCGGVTEWQGGSHLSLLEWY
jgi:hypothetical protein